MYEYKFIKDDCWYKCGCNKYNSNECTASCIRYMEMHYLMFNSNIPKNRQYPIPLIPCKQDIKVFTELKNLKEDIKDFVNTGKSLYIYSSNTGNGKTSWAIKLMVKYFDEIWPGNGFKCRGIYIYVPTFFDRMKDFNAEKNKDFENLKQKLFTADLVIWDDVASTNISNFDHTKFLTYIDQRNFNGLSNIYTGNLSEPDLNLKDLIGNRLLSRIWNESQHFEITGADRRGS